MLYLLMLMGALTDPTFTVSNFELTKEETKAYAAAMSEYYRKIAADMADYEKLHKYKKGQTDYLTAQEAAESDPVAQTGIQNQRTALEAGANVDFTISVGVIENDFDPNNMPTPKSIRRSFIYRCYDYDAHALTTDNNQDEQLTLEESKLPKIVFNLIDANADNFLTRGEIKTYVDAQL